MAFMNINDFILTLVALSLPSIAATIDCNGKPFHCLNSTHFMICVDFGSGVSSTMDDFIIPCPPTTVCQATNRFECEFPTVTTTTVTPVITNSPLVATVNNDVVIDTVSDVTTIPFEEYFNTISTTTLSEGKFMTRDAVTTELPVNNPESEVNVAATDSNINEAAMTFGISPNYFTTLATLDIVTDEATVTELIPKVTENVNVIFEPNSNKSGALPNATEIVPTDIDQINLNKNNTVDVTENYESNSTLLETIIGATNFRQFNTPINNSSYNVTKPILSEATESLISIPIDDTQVYLTTLDASPDVVLDDKWIENATESIPTKTTEYKNLKPFQSNSTLNESISTGQIVQNDPTTLNTALDTNGFAFNETNSDLSFIEITKKYEEQINTADPILYEAKENTTNILVDDKQAHLPNFDASPDVLLDSQTIDNATKSIPDQTTEYKQLIQPQSNRFNNKSLYNSTTYDVTEPILPEATESTISVAIDKKQAYLPTLDTSLNVVLHDKTIENVTKCIPTNTTEYKDSIQSQSNPTLDETMSTDDFVQNDSNTLTTVLETNGLALNANNSDLSFNEMTTKYEEQIGTAEPILFEAKENTTNIPVDGKQAYLPTLDSSLNVVLDDKTIENVTESIPTNTTKYKDSIQSQSNPTLDETMPTDDIVQNDSTTLTTALETNGFALNANNSDSSFNEITTKYEEQIGTAKPILFEAKENTTNIPVDGKQAYLPTLDSSLNVVLDDKTIENVTESIPTNTTEYKDSIQSQSKTTLDETMPTDDIVQNDSTTLTTALKTNGLALNANNSDLSFNDITTKYEEQIGTPEPILFEAKKNKTNIPVDGKQAYLPTLDSSSLNVVLDDKTIENVTKSIPTITTEYKDSIQSQSNPTLDKTMPTDDIVQNDSTTLTTALETNGFALNANNSDLSFNEITTKHEEQINTAVPVINEAKENKLDDKKTYWTLDASPDVFLDNKIIDTVTESIQTEKTEYRYIDSKSDSTLNASMSSGDIEQSNITTVNIVLNPYGSASNVYNSNVSLSEDTTPYYEQQISTENNIELSGNTGTEITQLKTDIANISKLKLSVSTIATTTVNTESVSTNTSNAAINTDTTGEVTVKLNVIESGNKKHIFDDTQATEFTFKVTNLTSTKDYVTNTSDNKYVKPEKNTKTTQSENLKNLKKTETEAEEIRLVLPKPPSSNETTTIVYGKSFSADNTSTTYTISNIDAIIAQNKTTLHDNSARPDEAQKVFTSEINVNDKTADATEKKYLLQPVTEPTSTPLSDIAHNVIGSDVTDENPHEMSTFINRIELTARGNITNQTLTQNVIGSDMNNSTEINVTQPNDIELNNRVSVLTADDQMNTVEISENTPNYILDTATQEADSFTYSNVYYQTNIEEISQGASRNKMSADKIVSTPSILVFTTESPKDPHFATILQATASLNSVSDKINTIESDNYLTSTTNSRQPEAIPTTAFGSIISAVDTSKPVTRENKVEQISTESSNLEITHTLYENSFVATEQNVFTTDITNSLQQNAITSNTAFVNTNSAVNQVTRHIVGKRISTGPSMLLISLPINETAYVPMEKNIISAEGTPAPADSIESVHQESRMTTASDFSSTKPPESFTQNDREIKETLATATTTSNTATDLSAVPKFTTVSNMSDEGVTNFGEEINGFTVVDSLTPETTVDAISKDTTENILEKYPITIKKGDLNPENIRNSTKTNTTTEDITVTVDTKHTEPLLNYNVQRQNISKLEITDETNQQSTGKLVTPKISTTQTLLNESLLEKAVLPVMPELKTNSESTVKNPNSIADINANPIITETSSFESHTERKLSFTTSIQESKSQSNLASTTESWREIVVTEPVIHPTRSYTETMITSSTTYTESNDQMSQDITSLTPKSNLANPTEKQYINVPQNMEPATKNVLTSSEPSVLFPQVTDPSGIASQEVQLSSVRKSTTQKPYGIDTLELNQRVSSTENHFINVTPLVSPSTITKPVDLSMRQSFTTRNTQILSKHHVFKNGEQIQVPTTEKLKVNDTPITSPSIKGTKPLVDGTAVPMEKSSNFKATDLMPNSKTHLITAVYNSKSTMESEPKTEFNKVQLNITSNTDKTVTQSSHLDIVIVDVIKTDSPNLGEIATGSNNTHSGISVIEKSTSRQVEKRKAIKNVAKDEHETEKEEKPANEKEEKPEVAETSPLNGKIEQFTSTEVMPIKKQANVQHNPPTNTKQKPIQPITTRTRPVDSHVVNTTARYNTKSKSPVENTHNSTLPASETSKQNFVCKSNNRGRFSDNGDCRKFYICIGKHEPIRGICPNNTVFSELRKQCTKNLSHCVRNNQFQCVSDGRFMDYLNDHIYYICVHNKSNRFIRYKLQCQNGYYVNKTSVRCVLNTESILSTSQQSKSASEVSTSNQSVSAKSEKIKEKPKTNKKFECKRSGKFPELNDCRKYYVCTKLGKTEYRQRSKKCDSDEVYHKDKKKCVDAESYECS